MRPVDHAVVSQHIRGANMACSNLPVSGESLPAAAPRSTLPQPGWNARGSPGSQRSLPCSLRQRSSSGLTIFSLQSGQMPWLKVAAERSPI